MTRITLIRHGETTANVAKLFQGREDSPLTGAGLHQLSRAAARLGQTDPFDLVVSSPQGRAVASLNSLGFREDLPSVRLDPDLVEGDPGRWEGLTRAEILEQFPDEIARLMSGEDIPIGGGERRTELQGRALRALEGIATEVGPDGRALVVTHGGVISAVAASILGLDGGRWPLARVINTALTEIELDPDRSRLAIFNDDRHLDESERDGYRVPDATHVVLMRHGQTEANAAGVWQGHQPGVLSSAGRSQAEALAGAVPRLDALYVSSLQRALDTAGPLATKQGLAIEVRDDLMEMAMGHWEGLDTEEITTSYPDAWSSLYDEGVDLPRGETGETFSAVASRMRTALDEIVAANRGRTVGIVSHGAALRALIGTVIGFGFAGRNVIPSMSNVAMTRLVVSERGPALATFNTAP